MARRQILNDVTDFGLNPKQAHSLDKTRLKKPVPEDVAETLGIWEGIELLPEPDLAPDSSPSQPDEGQTAPADSESTLSKEEPAKKSPPPKKKKKVDSEE
jgi:hypothetical protein